MATNDPVYVTFEFRGNLEDEVEKVTLGVKGLRDESAKTYQRLIADSNTAFNSMSADNRKMAMAVQENINALRDLSAVQKALDGDLDAGNITTQQYTKAKASLALQENNLREAISSGMQALNERIQSESKAVDSVMALQKRLQELTTAYYNLSKADREGATGQGILKQIGDLDKGIMTAQSRLSTYSRTAGTGFNSLSMSVQQVARELPSLTMGANMFFLAISNNLPILADNIRAARIENELQKKSGQTAVPVWKQVVSSIISWQTALVVGITLLTVYGKELVNWTKSLFGAKDALDKNVESLEAFREKVSQTVAKSIIEFKRMASEWAAMGDDMSAKKRYLLEHADAIRQIGVAVTDINGAEKIFKDGKQAFIESLYERAKAAAAMELAADKYKEAIRKMMDMDSESAKEVTFGDRMKSAAAYASYSSSANTGTPVDYKTISPEAFRDTRLKKMEEEKQKYFDEANSFLDQAITFSENEQKKLSEAGQKSTKALVDGSVAAIKASIAMKRQALEQLTNKADYDKTLKEIEAEQKKLETITGKKGEKDKTGPLGSIKYYNDLIAKYKELRDTAVTDEARKKFDDQIKEYEDKVRDIENTIIMSGKNVAVETLQSAIKGLDVFSHFDTRMDIEKVFGKLDTSDLDKLQDKVNGIIYQAKEAREGLLGILDEWKDLSDGEKAGRIGEECYKIADGLSLAAETAELFDGTLGSVLGTVAQLVAGVGDIGTGIGRALSGDVVGGATGIISGITGIIGSFKKRVEENKKILAEYQQSLLETEMKELEYNGILRERLRLTQQIGETALQYFDRLQSELSRQAGDIAKEYDEIWAKLMGEEYITATHYKHGTWFRKAKTWNDYGSLAGKTYEEIESLYTQNKLTDAARALFEQLKKLKEEGADVAGMMDDLNEEMKESWTGTTVDSIADSIIKGFAEGKRSAADFADSFQEMLNNAVLQGIKMKALEEPLRKWYESFAEASGKGLTADNIADLKAQYDKIIEDAAKQLEDMEKVTGLPVGAEAGRQAAAKGVASMSQDSANELNGNFSVLLIYAEKTSTAVTNINTLLVEGLTVMNRIAANTDRLENIEKDIRSMRNSMIDMLNKGLLMRKTA